MSSLSHVPIEIIQREAAAVRELLTGSLWNLELRPVDLGAETSPLVRAFWDTIGWDDSLSSEIATPALETNHQLTEELIEDYQKWGSPLELSALPKRYRMVIPDSTGVGFAVTDESGGELDPPVIAFSSEDGTSDRMGESYLQHATYELVFSATVPWFDSKIRTEPPLAELATDRPLPHLLPGSRTLTEDLWLVPHEAERPEPTDNVSIRSFDGLHRWLAAAPALRRISFLPLPQIAHRFAAPLDAIRAATPGWREIEGIAPAIGFRVGTLGKVPAIIALGTPNALACSGRNREAAAAWLAERGWPVQGK